MIKKFDFTTSSNTYEDYDNKKYAKIISIPKTSMHMDNWADDINIYIEVFWSDNYHPTKRSEYQFIARQKLDTCKLERINSFDNDTYYNNGLGYIVSDDSIDIYVRCGAKYYPVKFNVQTVRDNIFTFINDYAEFIDISNINLNYEIVLNKNNMYNELKTTQSQESIIEISNNTTKSIYTYTSTEDRCININLNLEVINTTKGSLNIYVNSSSGKQYFYDATPIADDNSRTFKNISFIASVSNGETITCYTYQYTNNPITVKLKSNCSQ